MKIIKEGKLTQTRATCPYCECEYEYDDTDINYYTSLTTTGYSTGYVICPCCHRENYISVNPKGYVPYNPYPYSSPIISYCNNQHDNGNHIPTIETVDIGELQGGNHVSI